MQAYALIGTLRVLHTTSNDPALFSQIQSFVTTLLQKGQCQQDLEAPPFHHICLENTAITVSFACTCSALLAQYDFIRCYIAEHSY